MGATYRPGNASKPGHLYSPLPFKEFEDIPYQREAVEERFELIRPHLPTTIQRPRLLDVGCHAGYNCFRLEDLGYTCTGIELDAPTVDIAREVNDLYSRKSRVHQCGGDAGTDHRVGQLRCVPVLLDLSVDRQGFGPPLRDGGNAHRHALRTCHVLRNVDGHGGEGKIFRSCRTSMLSSEC